MRTWLGFRPSPALLVGFAALFVALGGVAFAVAPTSTQKPMFFSSSAGTPARTVLNLDGLVIVAQCTVPGGGPKLTVSMRSTVAGASMQVSFIGNNMFVQGGLQNNVPFDSAVALNSSFVPMFVNSATRVTHGSQLSGTFTYTTPSGSTVTGTYQWWAGDTTPPPTGGNCLFSGTATGS
jgi:hypothetical protein